MKISIITVCYNSEKTIRDTIESVLSQTHSHIEYIVVDGASSDKTLSILNDYHDKITKIISEPDKGIYDAMNKGIQNATGEVIGILNSDDFYTDHQVIETICQSFESSPESELIFGDIIFVDPNQLNKTTRYYSGEHFKVWKLRFGWMPPHPATFIRRNTYQKLGLYSLNYQIAADYEMFVRLLMLEKCNFSYVKKVLVTMRSGGVSTSGIQSTIQISLEDVKACRSNSIYTNLFFILSKLPFKLLELIRRPV